MDRLSELPEPVLQRILYFLIDDMEGARTCLLSKSWRYIWSNRPKLYLSERTFKGNKKDFLFHANNTLQSLLHQNHQGVAEFHLTISTANSQSLAFLQKWIPMLTTMSVKHLSLHICPKNEDGVDLAFEAFAAEPLQKLHLCRCNLFQDHTNIPLKHHLTTLRLSHVSVKENQSIVDKIISSCPSLTTMQFEECEGLRKVKVKHEFHKNLTHFTFVHHESYTRIEDCSIEIDLPTLKTIKVDGSEVHFHNHEYSRLESLCLETVRISFDNSSSSSCSFPSLEDLRLVYYFYSGGLLCIDAPNIVKFNYVGSCIPSISFAATSEKWRSDIILRPIGLGDEQPWFLKLSKFLHSLRQSEITLTILNLHIPEDPLCSTNKPVAVENLQLGSNVPCLPALLDGLFCICYPRYIAHYSRNEQKELAEFLCNNRNQQEEIRHHHHHHHHLPTDVEIQSFDSGRGEWQLTAQNSLTQFASVNSEIFRKNRFLLKWRQDC